MKILVGDETGLIKLVSYEENQLISVFGNQEKDNEITFIEYLDDNNDVTQFC
jgi:hypothetical protein